MKKFLLVSIGLFSSLIFHACGGGEYEYFDFHSLFIGGQKEWECNCGNNGNIDEWKTFFDGRYNTNINKIVFSYSTDEVQKLMVNEPNPLYVEAFEYLIYAKKLGDASVRINGTVNPGAWDYDEILAQEIFDVELLNQGIQAFEKTSNKELKMRYAYQIIRYLHYNSKWNEAVNFFENHVPQLNLHNEMYYYCLDQVSGCYYSLEDYPTAAYGFLQVVINSKDRKESAITSFNIQSSWSFNALLEKCQTPNEKILARTLLTPYQYNYEDAKWIVDNEFDEQALMGIYYYSDVHLANEYFWLTSSDDEYYYGEKDRMMLDDEELIGEILKRDDLKHRDFWNCCMAYISFRNDKFETARNYINAIDVLTVVDENKYEFFKRMYSIFGKEGVTNDVENQIHQILVENVQNHKENNVLTDIFYHMVISFYLANDEFLKANLMTHLKDDIDQYYDLDLLDELRALNKNKNKNAMEVFLLKRSFGETTNIDDYLIEKKASLFLMHNNYEQAKEFFDQLPEYYTTTITPNYYAESPNYQFDGYNFIPKKVFSINVLEGFEFNLNLILDDETCYASDFDFIKDLFTKAELNDYLIQLNKMAASGDAKANYLLGNYYYNVSGLGYFRNLLLYYPENNLCSDCKTNEILQDYWYKSNVYYSQVIIYSEDFELKAKVTYLMSRNVAFNEEEYSYYDPHSASRSDDCYQFFDELKTTYSNTNFYNEILEECTVFSYYINK